MSVRGNAAPRGMTAHDKIRLTGSSCRILFCAGTDQEQKNNSPAGTTPDGADPYTETQAQETAPYRVTASSSASCSEASEDAST